MSNEKRIKLMQLAKSEPKLCHVDELATYCWCWSAACALDLHKTSWLVRSR